MPFGRSVGHPTTYTLVNSLADLAHSSKLPRIVASSLASKPETWKPRREPEKATVPTSTLLVPYSMSKISNRSNKLPLNLDHLLHPQWLENTK